jgi:preprotein translocase subunit SecD
MQRPSPRRAKLLALAVMIAAASPGDARAGAAQANSGWAWLLERLWSRTSEGTAEAAFKRAEAALGREGGSRLLLRIDTDALRDAMLAELRDDVRRQLREGRIPFADLAARDGSVSVRIREAKDRERAQGRLASLSVAAAPGRHTVDMVDRGDGSISLAPTESEFADRVHRARQQSIEVIERRLDSSGVAARALRPEGIDGIRVVLPGVKDLERAGAMFSKRARVTFRLVDVSMSAEEALQGNPPPGSEVRYELNTKVPLLLRKQVLLEGDDIVDAAPGFDPRTSEPIVTFRFNSSGARRFARVTEENIGRPFAIVLDDDVLSAPIIREPIVGGSGQISGSFTLEDANAVAVLLRSGTLPGRLTVVEQQVSEPEGKAAERF